jgi:hypothetical protein
MTDPVVSDLVDAPHWLPSVLVHRACGHPEWQGYRDDVQPHTDRWRAVVSQAEHRPCVACAARPQWQPRLLAVEHG